MTLLMIVWMIDKTILDKQWRIRHLYKIVDKMWHTVTFSPNISQDIMMKAKNESKKARWWVCRLLELKGRQLWATTYELIDWLDDCIFLRNQTIIIAAHKIEKMKDFFQKVKYAYDNMPDGIYDEKVPWWIWRKPKPQFNNVNELYFPENNSKIKITLDTRSWTPTRLHITELAFKEWADEMMAGTLPSVPASAPITIETTANGIWWYFYNIWQKNYWKPYWEWSFDCLFIPWYTDPLYVSDKLSELPREFEYIKSIKHNWEYLSQRQINRYCERIEELGRMVKQEFPSFPEEAFLTSWNPVFNIEIVKNKSKPNYIEDETYKDLRWYNKDSTRKAIYWVDTAEWWVKWDYSVVTVRDHQTMWLLACYRWHIPPDALCEVIDKINKVFSKCKIGIEKNNTWLATIIKSEEYKRYKDVYKEKILDEITMRTTDKVWWTTSSKTRPLMISEYEEAIRTEIIKEIDDRQESELYTFVYNEKNKAEALEWCHDDMIMADAICYQMRNERIWLVDVSPVVSPWNKSFISVWELEDDINARYAHLYK